MTISYFTMICDSFKIYYIRLEKLYLSTCLGNQIISILKAVMKNNLYPLFFSLPLYFIL